MKKLSCFVVICSSLVVFVNAQDKTTARPETQVWDMDILAATLTSTAWLSLEETEASIALLSSVGHVAPLIKIIELRTVFPVRALLAMRALENMGARATGSESLLIKILFTPPTTTSEETDVEYAARILAAIGGGIKISGESDYPRLDRVVVVALGSNPAAAPMLIRAFQGHSLPEIRLLALKVLGQMEASSICPAIPSLLWGFACDPGLAQTVLDKAASCPEAAPVLIPIILERKGDLFQQELQANARARLVKLGTQAVPELLAVFRSLDPGDIETYRKKGLILDVLGEIGPYAYPARETLLAWVSESLSEKGQVLYILGEIGNPGDMALFLEASMDIEWAARWRAVEGLGKFLPFLDEGNEKAAILAALADAAEDPDKAVAAAAKEALASFK